MSIDPVKIPQNVYIEDRIVGPLTLRQTLIMAGGGGFSYALWATLSKTYGALSLPITIIVWIPAVIAAAFALIKVNDLSLMRLCFLMLEKTQKPRVRIFTPRRGIMINIHTGAAPTDVKRALQEKELLKNQQTQEKIRELSSILDTNGSPLRGASEDETDLTRASEEETGATLSGKHEESEEAKSTLPPRPVDPRKISVDGEEPNGLSDLSVFRDIFPTGPTHG